MALADTPSMAVFCDFENVAIGVRDANYEKFDIKPVLERLLLKGGIVVKKAYCDWERYKTFKATMHEANFELIEIPHVRQSGKNSADIRMVVDALDLCYTKAHVDTFVIISGDSDFSPLVSKLRENAKRVIGVGVKQSCSDLLISNCDEFIFYDDLVRDSQRAARREREPAASKRPSEDDKRKKEELEARKSKAIDLAVSTFDALVAERGDSGKIWASLLKEAIKRRKPDFNETYFGFRAFGNLLEEAQARGLLVVGRDEKSGTWVHRGARTETPLEMAPVAAATGDAAVAAADEATAAAVAPANEPIGAERPARSANGRGRGRGGRKAAKPEQEAAVGPDSPVPAVAPVESAVEVVAPAAVAASATGETVAASSPAALTSAEASPAGEARNARSGRRGRGKRGNAASAPSGEGETKLLADAAAPAPEAAAIVASPTTATPPAHVPPVAALEAATAPAESPADPAAAASAPKKKAPARPRRPRATKAAKDAA
ncbi:NYN domain-containing protein [Rhodocyclus tenuis]|uniref:NYN domain-containing protein n=1 Tax=Rhodocyclus tenuis TaxID=1066 RepID=UPI0019080B87|nr:NYN domain-containing protein [Rhodocyclus tenuis]MBK1680147.1 NYN domain-containing protein [Rhodocyclus tenuis]